MKKRAISLLMTIIMILSSFAVAVPATAAEPTKLAVTANKTVVSPGETVSYTVSLGKVTWLGVLEFNLSVPKGMTIDSTSIVIPDGLKTTLDSDGDIVSPAAKNNWCWSYSAQDTGYTGTADLVLLTFNCKVDTDCAYGEKEVTVTVQDFCDNDVNALPYTVVPAKVTVSAAATPATGITLDKTALDMYIGDTVTLTATVTPAAATDKTVTWSSSDTGVATVDNGKIKAVGKGKATITAKTVNGKTATCEVTVYGEISVPTAISGLIYNGSEQIGVAEGTGYTLSGHKATNAGSYTATASLKSGYKWADGTTTAKTVTWKIDKKTVTPTVEVTGTYKYTGKAIIPTVVVKDGTKVIPATEYTVSVTDNTNAGTAKVTVTNKDGGNYVIETKEASFTIGKGTQNKPSGLNGVSPAAVGESTGKITGVSDKMEYRKAGETAWRDCTGTEITGLAAGDYEIRMKATANEDASAITTVTVRARRNTNTDSADRAYEEAKKNEGKKNTPTGGELVIISTVAVSIILLSSLIVFLAIVVSKKKKSVR